VLLGYDRKGNATPVAASVPEFVDAFRAGFPYPDWPGGRYYRVQVEGDRLALIQQILMP
jgi:hypothetical protein